TLRSKKHDLEVETLFQFGGVARFECRRTVVHRCFHLLVERACIGGRRSQRGDTALQINRYTHLVEQIDAENAVNFAPARISNRQEIATLNGNFRRCGWSLSTYRGADGEQAKQ